MPYAGANDPKLPSNVKTAPENLRAQWIHIFNQEIKKSDEETAFRIANGVLKKSRGGSAGKKVDEIKDLSSKAWGYDEGEEMANKATTDEELRAAVKDMIEHTPVGSAEHIKAQINKALNPPYGAAGHSSDMAHRVIGTYPKHVLTTTYDYNGGVDSLHKIPYKVDKAGNVTVDTDNIQSAKVSIEPDDDADDPGDEFQHLQSTSKGLADLFAVEQKGMPAAAVPAVASAPVSKPSLMDKLFGRGVGGVGRGVGGGVLPPEIDASALDISVMQKAYDSGETVGSKSLYLVKQASGSMRFFAPYTNAYKDRAAEIIATAGHKEYAQWATDHSEFPEAWLWHTKGTRWGQVDSLDFSDGVMLASGTVDSGCEKVALALASMGDGLGWSHGYIGLKDQEGVWTRYRDLEITALPVERAANALTSPRCLPLNILKAYSPSGEGTKNQQEIDMAFAPEKVAFYKAAGVPESAIPIVEKQHDAFVQAVKGLGLEWKDDGELTSVAVPGTDGKVTLKEGDVAGLAPLLAILGGHTQALTAIANKVGAASDNATKALEIATAANKSLEDAVAAAMLPKSAPAAGFKASEAGVVVTPSADGAAPTPGSPEARLKSDTDWFFAQQQASLNAAGLGALVASPEQLSAAAAVARATDHPAAAAA